MVKKENIIKACKKPFLAILSHTSFECMPISLSLPFSLVFITNKQKNIFESFICLIMLKFGQKTMMGKGYDTFNFLKSTMIQSPTHRYKCSQKISLGHTTAILVPIQRTSFGRALRVLNYEFRRKVSLLQTNPI